MNEITQTKDTPRVSSMSRRQFLVAGVGTVAMGISGRSTGWGIGMSASESRCQDGAVILPPLEGEWKVMNPPGHPDLADDFIGMEKGKRLPYSLSSLPRHLLTKMPVSRAYGWERPVYAPVSGTVIEVRNNEPDSERVNLVWDALDTLVSPPRIENGDVRPAAGNYVLINSDEGVAFLAHLRQGSITVTEGMQVAQGTFLGRVGNSGASLFPHLHFQLMSDWMTDVARVEEVLLPYRFSDYELRTGNWLIGYSWEPVQNCVPKHGDHFRIPPEYFTSKSATDLRTTPKNRA